MNRECRDRLETRQCPIPTSSESEASVRREDCSFLVRGRVLVFVGVAAATGVRALRAAVDFRVRVLTGPVSQRTTRPHLQFLRKQCIHSIVSKNSRVLPLIFSYLYGNVEALSWNWEVLYAAVVRMGQRARTIKWRTYQLSYNYRLQKIVVSNFRSGSTGTISKQKFALLVAKSGL